MTLQMAPPPASWLWESRQRRRVWRALEERCGQPLHYYSRQPSFEPSEWSVSPSELLTRAPCIPAFPSGCPWGGFTRLCRETAARAARSPREPGDHLASPLDPGPLSPIFPICVSCLPRCPWNKPEHHSAAILRWQSLCPVWLVIRISPSCCISVLVPRRLNMNKDIGTGAGMTGAGWGFVAPRGIWAAQRSHSQGVQVPMVPPAAKPSDCVVQTGARPWEQVLSIERYRMVKSQRCHRRREGGDSESDETSSRARGRDGGPSEVCRVPVLSSLQGLGEGALKREAGNLGGVGRSTEEREDHITRFQVQNFLKTKIRDHQRKVSQS